MWVALLSLGWQLIEASDVNETTTLPPTLSPAREAELESQYIAAGLITFAICIICLCCAARCKQSKRWGTPPMRAEDIPVPTGVRENVKILYDDNFGVGFSGGGIRSASFCSGVLWGLIHLDNKLPRNDDVFDGGKSISLPQGKIPQFISCVSGGGYIGSSFTYWARSMRGADPRVWSDEYFEKMRRGIGYYCDCTSLMSALFDTVITTAMFGILSVLSVLAWVPTTYVLGEFILLPYSAYYNAFTSPTLQQFSITQNSEAWNNDMIWLLWLFVVTGAPLYLGVSWIVHKKADAELRETFLGNTTSKRWLRWWKMFAEVMSHLNYALLSVFVIFLMVVLFDFSDGLSGEEAFLASDLTTTAVIWSLRLVLMYLIFTKSVGLIPLFIQAQILIWIYWSPHTALLVAPDPNFDKHYEGFAIFSKVIIPFLAVIGFIRERMIFEFSRWRLSRCFYAVPNKGFAFSYIQRANKMSRMMWTPPKFGQYPTFISCTTVNGWRVIPAQDELYAASDLLQEQEFNFYYEMLSDEDKPKIDELLRRAITHSPLAPTRSLQQTKEYKELQESIQKQNNEILTEAVILARNIVMANPKMLERVKRFEEEKVARAEALADNLKELAWSQANKPAASYDILAMSTEGWWERYEDGLIAPLKIYPEGYSGADDTAIVGANPELLLSEAMCMSAAAGSFANGEFGGLGKDEERTQVMFGLHMGRWVETNVKRGVSGVLFLILVDLIIGLPVIIAGGTSDPFKRTNMQDTGTNNGDYLAYIGGAISLLLFVIWCSLLPVFAYYCPRLYPFLPRARDFKTLTGEVNWSHSLPSMLYISDGGHTENLGLCPLLARRLKYIVLACGAEDETCEALRSALEQARQKLGCWFRPVLADQRRRRVDRVTSDPELDLLSDIDFFARDDARVMVIEVTYRDQKRSWRNYANASPKQNERGYIFYLKPTRSHPKGFTEGNDTMLFEEPFGAKCVTRIPKSHHTLGGCCCMCCHRFNFLNKISGLFPFHHTAFQFFTPTLFDAYHAQGAQAMKDAYGIILQSSGAFNIEFDRRDSAWNPPDTIATNVEGLKKGCGSTQKKACAEESKKSN